VVPRVDEYFGRAMHRLEPQRSARTEVFEPDELKIVDQVIDALWGKTATEVNRLSHDEKGWQMVEEGETIPYSAAFLSTTFRPTAAVREHAEQLSVRLANSR
jgi:hypothetical protein